MPIPAFTAVGPQDGGKLDSIAIALNAVITSVNAGSSLAAIANDDVLANISGGPAAPVATSLSALLDAVLGTTYGAILVRGASLWSALPPGSAGQVLTSQGAGAPQWASAGTPIGLTMAAAARNFTM